MSWFMDAIPFWGNTGALGLSDSMVHITPYSNEVPETYTKYKYWSSTHIFKKYFSTSSAFISSTSTLREWAMLDQMNLSIDIIRKL